MAEAAGTSGSQGGGGGGGGAAGQEERQRRAPNRDTIKQFIEVSNWVANNVDPAQRAEAPEVHLNAFKYLRNTFIGKGINLNLFIIKIYY